MYLHTPTYDLDGLLSANYHIHTSLSRCGKSEMVLPAIVAAAEKAGLKEIAITDHIHPGEVQKLRHNLPLLRRQLEQTPHNVRVYIGAELSAHSARHYSLQYAKKGFDLDYRLYAHNHYHMDFWEQPEDRSPAGYKAHCKACMETVIRSGKADCLAHPFIDRYIVHEFEEAYGFSYNCITSLWTENELGDMLTLGKKYAVAWELNTTTFRDYLDIMRMYFHLGKEIGVCFHLGTDAHRLDAIDPAPHKALLREIMK